MRLRKAMLPGARLLVVGAGLIGAEAASTALGLGCEVTLVDPVAAPLAHTVGSDVATWLHGLHTERGISVVTAGVESFADTAGRRRGPDLWRGRVAHLRRRAPRCGDDARDLPRRGGRSGDRSAASWSTPARRRRPPPYSRLATPRGVASTAPCCPARSTGKQPSTTAPVRPQPSSGVPGPAPTSSWFWTDRHGLHLEAVGKIAGAETTVVRGAIGDPSFSVFGLTGGRVVGAVAVDEPNAVRAARRLIDRGDRGRSAPSRRSQRRPAQAAPRLIPNGRAARRHTTYRRLRRRDRMVTVSTTTDPASATSARDPGRCGLAAPTSRSSSSTTARPSCSTTAATPTGSICSPTTSTTGCRRGPTGCVDSRRCRSPRAARRRSTTRPRRAWPGGSAGSTPAWPGPRTRRRAPGTWSPTSWSATSTPTSTTGFTRHDSWSGRRSWSTATAWNARRTSSPADAPTCCGAPATALQVARRTILLDQNILLAKNISTFF